jgi:hypothetical protein
MVGTIHYAQLLVAVALLILFAALGGVVAWGAIGILALALSVLVGWEVLSGRALAPARLTTRSIQTKEIQHGH